MSAETLAAWLHRRFGLTLAQLWAALPEASGVEVATQAELNAVAATIPATNTGTMPILLSSTLGNLNEDTEAKQPLYTCPASRRAVLTNIVMHKSSGSPGTAAFSIGWDGGVSDVASVDFNTAGSLGTAQALNLNIADIPNAANLMNPSPTVGTAAEVLGLKVLNPHGSFLTCKVDVFGYLTDTNGVPVANVLVP